jgi:hypothetical protein
VLENNRGVSIFLSTLQRVAEHVGIQRFRELLELPVNRGMLLSEERTKYHRKALLGFYVLTYNATDEKAAILRDVARKFGFPLDFLRVEVVG